MAGKLDVMDGNTAAAYVSYAFTEVAAIFPITPSSPMAEYVDEWAAQGKKNIFDQTVDVVEMQSEGGASGTVHGSLAAGALTTTYTASQGLLLMIPNIYKVAGELLPGVFHVSARSLSVHALSIFGDHSDVMACRQIGTAMLASSNPQEVMDLGAVAHLSAIRGSLPFIHYFDGFRTSHEIQKIEAWDYAELKEMVDMDAIDRFRRKSLNPERPTTRGCTENPDIYFQRREAANRYYDRMPDIVKGYMEEVSARTGRHYELFQYYGAEDAEYVIVAMGSVCDTILETIDYMNARGAKVGMINVHLYRPFSVKYFVEKIPDTVKRIAVLDRTKEPGAGGEPLYLDVCNAFYQMGREMEIYGGRYGLASKDTTPAQIMAVYEMLQSAPRHNFTIGIVDDVTQLSLEVKEEVNVNPEGIINCKLWGLGSDGTVGANKNSIKIIGGNTDMYCQAYFVYDSKKSGGLTQSHLRFGKSPIRSPYLVTSADFIACSAPSYLDKYDLLAGIRDGGTFLLNCIWDKEEVGDHLPADMKRTMAEKHVRFYIIDATDIARKIGMPGRTNSILQGAFFKLVPVLNLDDAVTYMKAAVQKTYAKKGQDVVEKNYRAIEYGISELVQVDIPAEWASAQEADPAENKMPEFIKDVVVTMNRQEGEKLPVSKFVGLENGTFPNGTTAYEKRGAAVDVPEWQLEKCIQCNRCSYVCPHAAIRPFLLDDGERQSAPESFETKQAVGKNLKEFQYRIQVSPLDCTGCGSCANVCPSKEKALIMRPLAEQAGEAENWKYAVESVSDKSGITGKNNVKNSQFAQPLFEFSGACAGCAETPYIKLVTQLFGDRMYVANASGCSSAYGGSTPSTPYTVNKRGHGTTWAMSLFEDNAEYAYGMLFGAEKVRERLTELVKDLADRGIAGTECRQWLEYRDDGEKTRRVTDELVAALQALDTDDVQVQDVLKDQEYLVKKSYWAFGGDGWAYDIGYGGLDHVLASGKNINILVLDTEVYSNTGGQSSKSTPSSAIAKFAASGKKTKKKDLGRMAMSYGYVYVAQVAMGYDPEQTLKAIREAENYDGPSLVIAYCPCIEHGIKEGMSRSQAHMKSAVEAGYWHLYRYNPELKKQGVNPFTLDSKEPKGGLREFLMGENRYTALQVVSPERAEEMYQKAEEDALERYRTYRKLAEDFV